ncbi:MAG TPA: alkaline phosphatase family protein [Thermoanaerobaculia bacterium]
MKQLFIGLAAGLLTAGAAAASGLAGLVVSAPATTTAGAAFTLNVAAVDAGHAALTGYTGTLHLTSTDGAATLPADTTLDGAGAGHANGVVSLTVLLRTPGAQQVTITDEAADVTASATMTVASALPAPASSGIDHIIVVMMENRSFDHFLGWLPGADGRQRTRFSDAHGTVHRTHWLAPDFQGCAFLDPGHGYTDGRVQYNGGACDGWLLPGSDSTDANPSQANDTFAIGFYRQQDLPFLGRAAEEWTVGDRYFAGILGPTFPNRFHQHSAQTDRLSNTAALSTLPTIWDRLAAAGLSEAYYFSDLPFLALWGPKYTAITKPFAKFLTDAAAGALPSVAFVDPPFNGELQGTSADDHPHGDIRNGEVFLNRIYDAVRQSPQWAHTLLVVNFDEWGGFFDHVPPPTMPIPDASKAAGDLEGRLGFRVPLLVISPYARRGFVAHETFDHTSILKLIEWRFGLQPLTSRDAAANNLADVLDFTHADLSAPAFTVPQGPFGTTCPTTGTSRTEAELRELARASGFALP